jgi:hypothetical protein
MHLTQNAVKGIPCDMDSKEEMERNWRSIWLLFGAQILLFVAILILCLTRPA